ncbi:DUF7512 family protein [Halobellus salinisoli]|uniref:DUF7512 family protein n=1 Tax=Halobellus salinisoli TaxID=3108500 RepID=UPI00300AF60A
MVDIGALLGASGEGTMQALTLVGAVLVEAIILYVGYGAVTRTLEPTVRRALSSE